MWIFLGLVSFLIAVGVLLYQKVYLCWTPDEIKAGNSWRYKHYENKSGIVKVCLGITGLRDCHFSFARESSRHKFGKWCGLAREFQTGDLNFDQMVYILSDNEYLHNILGSSSTVRRAVISIFNYGVPSLATAKELVCSNGNLWISMKTGAGYTPAHLENIAKALLPHLHAIKEEVNKASGSDAQLWRDPFFLKAMLIVSISSGLAINACFHVWRISLGEFPFLLDPYNLLPLATLAGLIMCAVLIALLLLWIGRSARTHLVFFELVTVGLFGAIATSFIELHDYNIEADVKVPEVKVVRAESVYSKRGRKSSTRYYLTLRDWRCDCQLLSVKIPYDLYSQLKAGDSVDVFQHEGALGYNWVSDIRLHKQD